MSLGERLKQLRTLNNLTMKDVAEKTQSTIPAVSNWENNKVVPSQKKIEKLAKLYKVKVIELTKLIERK